MSKTIEWNVNAELAGERLDAAINKKFQKLSRSLIKDMLKTGEITVNDSSGKPSSKVKGGEKIVIKLRDEEEIQTIEPTPLNFPIVFEDDHIIVINKPAGLVVHPGAGREPETVVSAILSHTKLSPVGAPIRPGVVQRLDKETTGIMILAKTREAHQKLAEAFSGRELTKEYIALVQGHIPNKKGTIKVAIERDRVHRKRMQATSPEKGRMAVSRFEVIEYLEGATLARVRIQTGRTHQIRVHMAYIGHPLYGDALYGGRKLLGKHEHFLHSTLLGMKHPITGEKMEWEVPVPQEFKDTIKELQGTVSV
jgi:23S rRNA pseudouridine1911/1915/1917 synthase